MREVPIIGHSLLSPPLIMPGTARYALPARSARWVAPELLVGKQLCERRQAAAGVRTRIILALPSARKAEKSLS